MEPLALFGGRPVRTAPFRPQQTIGAEEKAAALEVLDSGVLSNFLGEPSPEFFGGTHVQRTERAFAQAFGAPTAVLMNSATTALHAALAACGIGPGDEVIVPPLTMTASPAAVLMQHAIPVFADVHPDTFCLDPAAVRRAITPRTRAILMVDLFGQPAHWPELRAIATEHRLRVIEDAAQAAHATAGGRFAGTLGDVGVLSLNYHKIIHCGEGGVLLASDPELARRAQLVRNHGEAVVETFGWTEHADVVGSNYRMTELEAAIAGAQLTKLPQLFAQRRALAEHLSRRLRGVPGVIPPWIEPGVVSANYLYALKLAPEVDVPRERILTALSAEGIPCSAGYVRPLYLQPLYQRATAAPLRALGPDARSRYAPGACPVAERLHDRDLLLIEPCHPPQIVPDMDDVADAIEKVLGQLDALRRARTQPVSGPCRAGDTSAAKTGRLGASAAA